MNYSSIILIANKIYTHFFQKINFIYIASDRANSNFFFLHSLTISLTAFLTLGSLHSGFKPKEEVKSYKPK